MQTSGTWTRRLLAVAGATIAAGAGAAPAVASDAGLRKVVTQQEKRVAPLAQEFSEAAENPSSAVGIERFSAALKKLQAGTSTYRKAVTLIKTTDPKIRRGRADLVVALKRTSDALVTYREGLQFVLDEQPKQAKARLATAKVRLASADARITSAVKRIGAKRAPAPSTTDAPGTTDAPSTSAASSSATE